MESVTAAVLCVFLQRGAVHYHQKNLEQFPQKQSAIYGVMFINLKRGA